MAKVCRRNASRPLQCLLGILIVAVAPLPALAEESLETLLQQPSQSGEDEGEGSSDSRDERPPSMEGSGSEETGAVRGESGAAAPGSEAQTASTLPQSRAAERQVIEEIVVTAQKREQRLKDVPISMSVLDSEFLHQESMTDLQDVSVFVPSVKVSALLSPPDVRIRGFGTPLTNNKAFEQSVGLVIDGIPYGRVTFFEGPLFDLERVEVLRGPQGTLFGKNTTAGLFNIVTAKPTDEYTGYINFEKGDLGRQRVEGAVGGPLVAGIVNFRISVLDEKRDGFFDNTTHALLPEANAEGGTRDRQGARVQLEFPDLLGVELGLNFQTVDFELTGLGSELTQIDESVRSFFLQFDPNVEEKKDFVGSVDTPTAFERNFNMFVADARYTLGGWEFNAITGFTKLRNRSVNDGDFSPAPILGIDSKDDAPQTTLELRASSPPLAGLFGIGRLFGVSLGSSNLTTGLFFQKRRVTNSRDDFTVNWAAAGEVIALQEGDQAAPVGPVFERGSGDPGILRDQEGVVETLRFGWNQDSTAFAGFGQLDWSFFEQWGVQYGMRLSHERKEATWDKFFIQGSGAFFMGVIGDVPFEASRSRSDLELSPKLALTYDWTDDVRLFASWGQAFKAGGYNTLVTDPSLEETFEFAPERTTAYEIGAKTSFLGGTAQANLGLFWQDMNDLQVFTLTPDEFKATVRNAGKARSRGLEGDLSWLPTNWLTVRGAVGFDDTEFLEFPFGGCLQDRQDSDGDGDPRCDLSGKPFFNTPMWTFTLVPRVNLPLANLVSWAGRTPNLLSGLELTGSVGVHWEDEKFASVSNIDPRLRVPSFFRVDANLGLESPAQGWSIGVTGENLTDHYTTARRDEVIAVANTFADSVEPPRTLFGGFRWEF